MTTSINNIIQALTGAVGTPAIYFGNDTTTGIYNSATNTINFTTAGVNRLSASTTAVTSTLPIFAPNGTAAAPSFSFSNAGSDDGMYSVSPSAIGFSTVGTNRLTISSTAMTSTLPIIAQLGTVSAPSYTFTGDTNTGIYSSTSDIVDITTGGVNRLSIASTGVSSSVPVIAQLGSVSAPSYTFTGDTNTGIYSSTADNIDISAGGSLISNFSTTGLLQQEPIIIDKDSTETLLVRKNGDPAGGDMFSVDTTNSRIGIGNTNTFLARSGTYNSTTGQGLLVNNATATTTFRTDLALTNTGHDLSTTIANVANFQIGRSTGSRNSANISYQYIGDNSTSNKLRFGIDTVSGDILNVQANSSVNVTGTFSVSSTSAFSGQITAPLGAVGTPSYSFTGDTNTGIYSSTADIIDFTAGGTNRLSIASTGVSSSVPVIHPLGSVSAPSITFTGDTNTGMYSSTADIIDFTAGGTNRLSIASTGVSSSVPVIHPVGTVGSPSVTFAGRTDMGLYSQNSTDLCFSTLGSRRMTISATSIVPALPVSSVDQPFYYATTSGTQSISPASITTFTNWTPSTNRGFAAISSGILTVPDDGTYLISTTMEFESNTTGIREIIVWYNNTTSIAQINVDTTSGGFSTIHTVSTCYLFLSGDNVRVRVYQNSGGSLLVGANTTNFSVTKLW
jgi:hypothetical protein